MNSPKNRKLIADTSKVTGAVGLAYLINLLGGLFIADLLGVYRYGVWKAIQLILEYTAYANLGTNHGIDRQCPALVSNGNLKQYKHLLSTSISFSLILSGLLALCFFALSTVAQTSEWQLAFASLGFLVVFQQLFINSDSALGAEKKFGTKSLMLFVQTLVRVVLSVVLGWFFGLSAVITVFAVVLLVGAMIQLRALQVTWGFRFSKKEARGLILSGATITILVLCERLIMSADRIAVGFVLGEEAFGIYNMAVFPLPILLLIPFSLRQTVQTEIYDHAGKHLPLSTCWPVFSKSLRVISLLAPFFAGAVFLGMPMLFHQFLQEFEAAIPLVQLFALSSFPLQLIQIVFPVIVVKGNFKRLIPRLLTLLLIPTTIGFIGASQGLNILIVLAIQSVGWFIISLWLLGQAMNWFQLDRAAKKSTWIWTFTPLLLTALELPLLHILMTSGFGWEAYGWAYGFLGGCLHTLFCSGFFLLFWREMKTRRIIQ